MKILKQFARTFRKDLDFVIFFVTTRCNSRCKHCFFWKSLNQKDELDLEEIKKIFRNLGKVKDISLSGGEPILREDILDIIKVIYENNKIQSLSIPSNGLLPERLEKVIEEILKKYRDLKLLVNLSIDGLEKIQDNMRGIDGNFKKSMLAARKLIGLKKKYSNLYVNINSVITSKNISELEKLMSYVRKNLDVDGHYFEVIRGNSKDKDFKIPELKRLVEFYKLALENEEFYFNKRFKRKRVVNLGYNISRMFYEGVIKYLYSLQIDTLRGKKWPFPCLAGQTSLVIYPKGEVSVCELKNSLGNLRDYNYDIKKIRATKRWKNMLKMIKKSRCSCTHDCFIYNTVNHTPVARLIYLPINYFKKLK